MTIPDRDYFDALKARADEIRREIAQRQHDEDTTCQWFARCDRAATHDEPHPVLGSVPACDRCPNIGR